MARRIIRVDIYHLQDLPDGSMNVEKSYFTDLSFPYIASWIERTIVWATRNERGIAIEKFTGNLNEDGISLFEPPSPEVVASRNQRTERTPPPRADRNSRSALYPVKVTRKT